MTAVILYFLLVILPVGNCLFDTYCNNHVSDSCKYRCHCETNNEGTCDGRTGACNNGQECSPGWMGRACQYSNVAYNKTSTPPEITDGKSSTCHDSKTFTVDLQKNYPVSSFSIISRTGSSSVTALVKSTKSESKGLNNTCLESVTVTSNSTDLICTHTIFGRYLEVSFDVAITVCEIQIHGGRNIALWQHTEQSDTYQNYGSGKAVDGEIGNFSLGSNHCSHAGTSSHLYNQDHIKPYWKVHFTPKLVQRIKIYFREDVLWRYVNFKLTLVDNSGIVHAVQTMSNPTREEEFILETPLLASTVNISLPNEQSTQNNLELCEVQVFACRLVPNGRENCANFCPINCKNDDNNNHCQNFTCPENKCKAGWTGEYCNQILCHVPDEIDNNIQVSPNFTHVGSAISLSCKQGYTLYGFSKFMCQTNGSWSQAWNKDHPTCKANMCSIPNGLSSNILISTNATKVRFGKTINITCATGYTLNGPKQANCQDTGYWSPPWTTMCVPKCEANTCQIPNNKDDQIRVTPNRGWVLFNTIVNISCELGYTLRGTKEILCQTNGTWNLVWNETTPWCEENKCVIPNKIDDRLNYTTSDTSLRYKTTVKFTCRQGYSLIGPVESICNPNGTWNNTWNSSTPICKENKCVIPNKIDEHLNYTTSDTSLRYKTTVKFTCRQGYSLIGPVESICNPDGTWNNTWNSSTPICKAHTCTVPYNIDAHLDVKGPRIIVFGNKKMLSCFRGYSLQGPNEIICNVNGQWSHEWNQTSLSCTANICSFPDDKDPKLILANVSDTVLFDESVDLSCKNGNLFGPQTIKCNSDGQWDHVWNSSTPACIQESSELKSSGQLGIAVGSGVGAAIIVIVVLAVVGIFVKRRRNSKNESRNKPYDEIKEPDEGNVYCNIVNKENGVAETTLTEENSKANDQNTYYAFLPKEKVSKTAIDVDKFKDYVEECEGHGEIIKEQFSSFVSGLKLPATVALSQQNKMKNKYKNICAYDDTRVVLKPKKDQPKTDYINACYINGYESVRRYVASQGPIKGTEEDFWEMIFQLGSDKIVMLTNLIEEGKQKCEQYWPEAGEIQFGEMKIRLRSIDRYADFTIRNLSISQAGSPWKDVKQFHFTSWPDKGVPKYASSLVHFRSKVLAAPTKGKGPLVVHCSAGIGRTGTFIALDYLVSQASTVGQVDLFTCVETLRRQRVNMVQTSEQYLFLHFALEEAIICKASATASAEFPKVYSALQEIIPRQKKRGIDKEFETLNETSPRIQEEDFVSGKAAENKMKNRNNNILPVESHRIFLYTNAKGRSDYINAVMLPSYREKNAFIVTQMPLEDTVIDFCRLVYENDVTSIVMLNEITKATIQGQYWPNNTEQLKFGNFTLEKTKEENLDSVVINHLNMQYESQEPRTIKQFQVKFWPDAEQKPRSAENLLTVMELVHVWQRNTGNNPVVVHCMNGCDRSGLYCVIEATIERLKIEQDVGIQQIIKQMRSRRPQIIPNIEQYEFCHEAVLEYLQQFETYSNFQ